MQLDQSVEQTKAIMVKQIQESFATIAWLRGLKGDNDTHEALDLWHEGLVRAMPHIKEDWND